MELKGMLKENSQNNKMIKVVLKEKRVYLNLKILFTVSKKKLIYFYL